MAFDSLSHMAASKITTRTFGPLHFEDLDPSRFEDLLRQVIYDFRPWRSLEATGRAGSDSGFDARGFEITVPDDSVQADIDEDDKIDDIGDRLWLVQCKREKDVTQSRIKQHLAGIPDASAEGLHGVIFVAACNFSKKTRDVFREWCSTKGIAEAHIWDKAELEDQLYQPKNDGLLFAYFGFSLRIRRRSVRTELRARLAMKRKAERILQGDHGTVLLRDPTDDRYPFLKPDERGNPERWRVARFLGHHPLGIMLEIRRFYAYLDDSHEKWDYLENSMRVPIEEHENPWRNSSDAEKTLEEHRTFQKMWTFWSGIPE